MAKTYSYYFEVVRVVNKYEVRSNTFRTAVVVVH